MDFEKFRFFPLKMPLGGHLYNLNPKFLNTQSCRGPDINYLRTRSKPWCLPTRFTCMVLTFRLKHCGYPAVSAVEGQREGGVYGHPGHLAVRGLDVRGGVWTVRLVEVIYTAGRQAYKTVNLVSM